MKESFNKIQTLVGVCIISLKMQECFNSSSSQERLLQTLWNIYKV